MNECPLCGEEKVWGTAKGWHYWWDPEYLTPEEGSCDFCGFFYQQYTPSAHNDMLEALDDYMWSLDARLGSVDEEIEELLAFKAKIPELKRRIDFDALRIKLGYKKTKEGWTKEGSHVARVSGRCEEKA